MLDREFQQEFTRLIKEIDLDKERLMEFLHQSSDNAKKLTIKKDAFKDWGH